MAQQKSKLPSGEGLSRPMVAYHQAVEGRIDSLQETVEQVEQGAVTIDGATGDFTIGYALSRSGQELSTSLTRLTASLGADVALNNTGLYFDGPSVAQGTTGTWLVTGAVTVTDSAAANLLAKLWDGTTVIASCAATVAASGFIAFGLSGIITNPAGNLRISVRDLSTVNGLIKFNSSSNSKDSTITAVRIA